MALSYPSFPEETRKLALSGEYCCVANPHDSVYNNECVFTFHSPFTSDAGILVNLHTFAGTIQEFALESHDEALFVRIVKQRALKEEAATGETPAVDTPTTLGIGVEGGFASEEDKYETTSHYSLVHLRKQNGQVTVVSEVPYDKESSIVQQEFPMILTQSIDSIVQHTGSSLQQDVAVWKMEQDDLKPSKYAHNLPFVDNGVSISPDPSTWKCQKSGDAENVWLNLSTGYMGGGRKNWDGSGGSNGALDHFNETNQQYPLVVKLGTITSDISTADCYSYAPDEDGPVLVPNLADLLEKRGIMIHNLQKTAKSTAELEVELNANYAFDAITESGAQLKAVAGPNLQGLQNLGNSCYMNSVVQVLFHLPELAKRYGQKVAKPSISAVRAPTDLICQTHKLASALVSGEFAKSDPSFEDNNPKYRLAPRMFKHVVGKDHIDFKTGQQQDASQFLQYYLEQLDRAEKTNRIEYPASHLVSFATETRSKCTADQKVKYDANTSQRETVWTIPIPMDLATVTDAAMEPDHKKHKPAGNISSTGSESTSTTVDTEKEEEKEEPVKSIGITTCLDKWAAETTVDDIAWSHLGGAKHAALQSTKLVNFPRYLFVQLQRYTLGPDWQPIKLQVNLEVPKDDEGKYVIDLSKYKSVGGAQPNEVLIPEETATASAAPSSAGPVIDEAALSQLMDMGFSLNSCKRALNAVGGSNVDAAMGWVFEHNNDPDFNDPLPDESAAAVSSTTASQDAVDEGAVQSLVEMLGCFTADQVRFALKETNGASDRAADWLFSHMDDVDALMIAAAENKESDTGSGSSSAPDLEDSSDCSIYQLTGLVSHIGKNTGSGHYVAHILVDGKWIIFNDEKVAESEHPPVEHAYLYLLQRTDTIGAPPHDKYCD